MHEQSIIAKGEVEDSGEDSIFYIIKQEQEYFGSTTSFRCWTHGAGISIKVLD